MSIRQGMFLAQEPMCDGLVEGAGGADGEGRIACRLTDQGQAEIRRLARVETGLARATRALEARTRDTAGTYRGGAPEGTSR